MESIVEVTDVLVADTRSGAKRYVLKAGDGTEYTTFRPGIGEEARKFVGRSARIEFHEQERGEFKNVYLDAIAPAPDQPAAAGGPDTDPAEVAWRTAVEAAPIIVGDRTRPVEPERLFEKLKPFKDRVERDILDDGPSGEREDDAPASRP